MPLSKRKHEESTPSTSRESNSSRTTVENPTAIAFDVQASDLQDILCYNCKKYLTISPVMVKDVQYICGNCYYALSNKKGYKRCIMYENLAKLITFPCRNQTYGCPDKFVFNTKHNGQCKFEKYLCSHLSSETCYAGLLISEMKIHFETKHSTLISNNPAIFQVDSPYKKKLIIEAFDNIFICHVENGPKNNILYGVQSLDEDVFQNFEFDIKVNYKSHNFGKVENTVQPYRNGVWDRLESNELSTNFKKTNANKSVNIEINIRYKQFNCTNFNCAYTSRAPNLKKHEKYFCNKQTTCFACSEHVDNLCLHLNIDHANSLNNTKEVSALPISDQNWWIIQTSKDKTILYYCQVVKKNGSMFLQITSPQEKNNLRPLTIVLTNSKKYRIESPVMNDLYFDWEWKLSNAGFLAEETVKFELEDN